MRVRVAAPRSAGRTDGPSSPIFINYWLRVIRSACAPRAPWPHRGPSYSGRRNGPSFTSARVASLLALSLRHCWVRSALGCWLCEEQQACSRHPPEGPGVLGGSVQERPGAPGGPQHGPQAGKETPGPQGSSQGSPSLLASSLRARLGLEGESFVPALRRGHFALQGPWGPRTPAATRSLGCLRALHSLPPMCRGSRPQLGSSLRLRGSHSPAWPLAGRGVAKPPDPGPHRPACKAGTCPPGGRVVGGSLRLCRCCLCTSALGTSLAARSLCEE